MKKAGLIKSTGRGYFCITERGMDVLKKNVQKIDANYLTQFEDFREFKKIKRKSTEEPRTEQEKNPEEALESAHQYLRNDLANELLHNVKAGSPSFFEKLVVELLLRMGYGGSRKDAGEAIGKTNDEGIDGIIREDRLGLDIIYIYRLRNGIIL
jgi:restriction system protein